MQCLQMRARELLNEKNLSNILQFSSKKGHYFKRWLDLLVVISEKGKGPIAGKLQMM